MAELQGFRFPSCAEPESERLWATRAKDDTCDIYAQQILQGGDGPVNRQKIEEAVYAK